MHITSSVTTLRNLALPGLLLATLFVYWPGLHGTFLFDDYGNLPALGAQGPIDNLASFWRYVTSGTADPTGRPLTLLTFLLDANNWPADPYPFKRTNVILHLCNGFLLYSLLTRLGRQLKYEIQQTQLAALLGTALWLLHPLLVSTTLYIVQREAMLPATCVLAGLRLWLHGYSKLNAEKIRPGLIWSALGLGGFTFLGALTKANGVLLPVYALLIEVIVLAPSTPLLTYKARRVHRTIFWLLAILPTIAILLYLVWTGVYGIYVGGLATGRSWSYAQRLLTEPRVLLDYLQLLWMPRPLSSGLFNDQYTASTSWLHPFSTIPSLLAVLALIGCAWWRKGRHPALALAVLFYFAGQLFESTSVPLELYFEHRNYVPALLLFWPLSLWLANPKGLRTLKYVLMVTLPLMLASMTYTRAEVWGNEPTQALVWARINPDSPRAQANAALIEIQAGYPLDAIHRLESLLARRPDQAQLAFNLIDASCAAGSVPPAYLEMATRAMSKTANIGTLFVSWFEQTIPTAGEHCQGMAPQNLLDMINAGLKNPNLNAPGPQQDLLYLRGKLALQENCPKEALQDFIHALDLDARPNVALKAAAELGTAGHPLQGLYLLDHYQRAQHNIAPPNMGMPVLHAWVLARQNYWPKEISHLRHQLDLDARDRSTNLSPLMPCPSGSR